MAVAVQGLGFTQQRLDRLDGGFHAGLAEHRVGATDPGADSRVDGAQLQRLDVTAGGPRGDEQLDRVAAEIDDGDGGGGHGQRTKSLGAMSRTNSPLSDALASRA